MDAAFVVLVPVKPPARGKSRLGDLDDDRRRRLAAAFALDTVSAALASPTVARVLVVGDDHELAREIAGLGAEVVPDGVTDDLNEALRLAAREAARRWPDLRPVALLADLPAVRASDLDAALLEVGAHPRAFVPDADGDGTVLFSADVDAFLPRFGAGSAVAHASDGAVEVGHDVVRLRRDVDDSGHLAEAVRLGVGWHTSTVLA